MSCPFEEEVSTLFDGELEAGDAERVTAHIATCQSCRAMLADFQELRASLQVLPGAPAPSHMPSPALSHDQRGAARATSARGRGSVPLYRRYPAWAMAAVLVLALLLIPIVVSRRSTPSPSNEAFARYDGGRRAVIYVRPQEQRR